jgi:hypothetical protein
VALIQLGGGPHVTGETGNEILDVSGRPVSSHPHLATLKLVTVRADEIFLAVCLAASPCGKAGAKNILKR